MSECMVLMFSTFSTLSQSRKPYVRNGSVYTKTDLRTSVKTLDPVYRHANRPKFFLCYLVRLSSKEMLGCDFIIRTIAALLFLIFLSA